MLKLTAYVSGKVQMAGYRSKVVTIARVFGLKGYVRNLPDGRVEVLAEGPDADLERFIEAIRIKNTLIDVTEIKTEFSDAKGAYGEFFKIAGERETDARLDQAAEYLKELISVVREGFKDNGSKLDGIGSELGSKLDDIGSKLDGMGPKLDGIGSKLDGMGPKLDGIGSELGSKLDGIGSKLDGIGPKLDGIGSKLDGIGPKLDGIGSKLDGIGPKLDGIGSKLDGIGPKLDGMSSCLKEISGKQDQIIDTIDDARGEIVSEVKGMRSDLKGRSEERLQRIESDVTEIKARMRS